MSEEKRKLDPEKYNSVYSVRCVPTHPYKKFHRAGLCFVVEPTLVDFSKLSVDNCDAILTENMLVKERYYSSGIKNIIEEEIPNGDTGSEIETEVLEDEAPKRRGRKPKENK